MADRAGPAAARRGRLTVRKGVVAVDLGIGFHDDGDG